MLIKDFYKILEIQIEGRTVSATIRFNPEHDVYKGHFPGQPVVPGVVQIQIVKEILEEKLNKKLFLRKVNTAKYLKMIIPDKFEHLQIGINYQITGENACKINALIGSGETVFTKLKAVLTIK